MAPEAGLEPTTRWLIPTRRDSTIKQVGNDPFRGFLRFDLPLSLHGSCSGRVLFAPNKFPRSVLSRVLASWILLIVMRPQPFLEVLGRTNVESSYGILENICPVGGHGKRKWLQR